MPDSEVLTATLELEQLLDEALADR
jgi:hypothetical protein